MENPLQIMLIGATGRLGTAIQDVSHELPAFHITERISRRSSHLSNIANCDVVLDVSLPVSLERNLKAIVDAQKPLVIGSTGHSQKMLDMLKETSEEIPILLSSNFSHGIAAIRSFFRNTSLTYVAGISETHHESKKDAPSGTAKELAHLTSTPHEEIEVIRSGDALGEHKITLKLDDEIIEISHKVLSRNSFAKGALLACQYLSKKEKGMYSTIYD